ATEYLPRMDKQGQDEVKAALAASAARLAQKSDERDAGSTPASPVAGKTAGAPPAKPDAAEKEAPRFFFDLTSAALIPKCMVTESKVQRSRGPVKDLWDQGFTISQSPSV